MSVEAKLELEDQISPAPGAWEAGALDHRLNCESADLPALPLPVEDIRNAQLYAVPSPQPRGRFSQLLGVLSRVLAQPWAHQLNLYQHFRRADHSWICSASPTVNMRTASFAEGSVGITAHDVNTLIQRKGRLSGGLWVSVRRA